MLKYPLSKNFLSKEVICGIYGIINTKNNKIYVGKSKNIYSRLRSHIKVLTRNTSKNHFQYAYNKDKEHFYFTVLKECDEKNLDDLERFFIRVYYSWHENYGYNSTLGGEGGCTTEKSRKQISKKISELWKNEEYRENQITKHLIRYKQFGGNTKGIKYSEELCKKMSESRKKLFITNEEFRKRNADHLRNIKMDKNLQKQIQEKKKETWLKSNRKELAKKRGIERFNDNNFRNFHREQTIIAMKKDRDFQHVYEYNFLTKEISYFNDLADYCRLYISNTMNNNMLRSILRNNQQKFKDKKVSKRFKFTRENTWAFKSKELINNDKILEYIALIEEKFTIRNTEIS